MPISPPLPTCHIPATEEPIMLIRGLSVGALFLY